VGNPHILVRSVIMTEFGYFLPSEEHTPSELVEQARMAERAGFTAL
jgi:hypothetical protein